ncbi:hypothetical protein [Croceicoccus sp. Ery15]|uniref:hypothetical protein n=1 Tax=Croceicoccus sp. Ery15 TaxID=1703338 RepID=UPI001E5AE9B1|nr:hypothetical protein [Croceicoccus sp. Ery15]
MFAAKLKKLGRLFVIKTRIEAYLVIYALGLGAAERGTHYLDQYPGYGGYLLFLACTGSVFLAGAKILDCVRMEREKRDTTTIPTTAD